MVGWPSSVRLCKTLNEREPCDCVAKRVKLMALQPCDLFDVFKTDTRPTVQQRKTGITPADGTFTSCLSGCPERIGVHVHWLSNVFVLCCPKQSFTRDGAGIIEEM
jgi:hypothetical protein